MPSKAHASVLGEALSAYADSESWKSDHDDAMTCRDLEQVLVLGIHLYQAIFEIDHNWRLEMLAGRIPHDPEQGRAIADYLRTWAKPCERILRRIDAAEAKGATVHCAEEFRRSRREVMGALTPDDQFFAGEKLVRLRDDAIDAHREGLTADFHVIGK